MTGDLTLYDLSRISELFATKKWPIDEFNKESLYNRFLRTYNGLNGEERELFIKLSNLFEVISLDQYQRKLALLIQRIIEKYLGQKQTIYIYPIKKKEDREAIKSSDVIAYLCKGTSMQYFDKIYKKKFIVLGTMKRVEEKKKQILNSTLIIVDDFIGSGDYASGVVQELMELGIVKENIVIMSLYASEMGYERLRHAEYNIESMEIIGSCIAQLCPRDMKILSDIESKLKGLEERCTYGYNHSGTLISLIRTPNNSLPIFWLNHRSSPFPR